LLDSATKFRVVVTFRDADPRDFVAEFRRAAAAPLASQARGEEEMKELIYSRHLLPAARHEDHVAIIDGSYRATLKEHTARVLGLCRGLASLGVKKAD